MDSANLAQVQKLVTENPILSEFLLHRLGNILTSIPGYAELIDMPTTTDAQRQKYVANIKGCVDRVFAFLRECNVEHEHRKAGISDDSGGDK